MSAASRPAPRRSAAGGGGPALWIAASALLAASVLGACTELSTTRHPVGAGSAALLRTAPAARSWDVLDGDTVVGEVTRFEAQVEADGHGPGSGGASESGDARSFLYVVRNVHGQDIGLIDSLGRARKRRLHGPDEHLGAGTLEAGVRRILALDEPVHLEPRALGGAPSDLRVKASGAR